MHRYAALVKAVGYPVLLHSIIVAAAALLSLQVPEQVPAGFINPLLTPTYPFVEKFIKWDAHWYTYAAQQGYDQQSIVFFPVIILLLRGIWQIGIPISLGGFVICNLFAIASFFMLYLLLRKDFSECIAQRALYAYAVMPTSFFLNSIYTESLFLTFSLACIYFTRQRQWWLAGIFATLAALTRNLGIFLMLVMMCEYIVQYWRRRRPEFSLLAFALPPLGIFAFMGYNLWRVGSAVAFINGQKAWGRQFEYPWVNIWNNIRLLDNTFPQVQPGVLLDTVLVAGCLVALLSLTFMTRFKIRLSYLLVGWLWFLIPLFSTSAWFPLYSMSRFILIIFPVYVWIGQLPNLFFYSYMVINMLLLSLCTFWFTGWRWLG